VSGGGRFDQKKYKQDTLCNKSSECGSEGRSTSFDTRRAMVDEERERERARAVTTRVQQASPRNNKSVAKRVPVGRRRVRTHVVVGSSHRAVDLSHLEGVVVEVRAEYDWEVGEGACAVRAKKEWWLEASALAQIFVGVENLANAAR